MFSSREKEKLPRVHHSVDASFPCPKTNELCRRNNNYSLETDDLWVEYSSMQLRSSTFHRLRKVGFLLPLLSLFPSLHLSATNQSVVPCIFLSCPVEISLASSSFLELPRNFIPSRCPLLSLSLSHTFSLHPLSTHPRVGKIAVSIFSPSELYTRYIMNIVISRRSYTVRSFLKWKSTGKVGRGLRVTFRLLDPPAPESSYRLSRLSSTSSIALVTYFTFSIAFLFFPFLPPSPFQVACIIN